MIEIIISVFLVWMFGFFIALIFDVVWFEKVNFKKVEKGMEAHEHYHIGLELGIIAVLVFPFAPWLSVALFGVMFGFIVAEWTQDHKFALGSVHFKASSYIGIGLSAVLIILSIVQLGGLQ